MDACYQPSLLPVSQAIESMLHKITPVTEIEIVDLLDALDRVIAEDIYSAINVPGHDNSAMDGYALRHQDMHMPLKIIGQSFAGHPFNEKLTHSECVRVMTGAVIPEGADTVIMQENVQLNGDIIAINQPSELGENIRRAGEDVAINSLVFKKGKRITPVDIGLLASLGIAQLPVFRRIKIAVLSTGDELKPLTKKLKVGEIYDSNRPALIALLSRLAVDVIDIGCIADDPEKISAAFDSAINQADAVISSGGVSVGDADHTKSVLEARGEIHFWKIAMKPGKPFAFGSFNNTKTALKKVWFFGLPGNPVSSIVTYHQLVVPALRHLAGEVFDEAPVFTITTQTPIRKQKGRADYQRGNVKNLDGKNYITPIANQSSGVLSSVSQANCYIVVEQARGSVTAGEEVNVVLFDKFLL